MQLLRDNKHLSEACEDLQKKTSKLQHDVTAKDGQISHLEAKMARNKQLVDGESGKVLDNTGMLLYIFVKRTIVLTSPT